MTEETLLPCPFCGAGETQIREQKMWSGTRQTIISVSILHWCTHEDGQPSRAIERIGKDRESAINAWNKRYTPVRHSNIPVLRMTLLDGTPVEAGKWPFPSKDRKKTDEAPRSFHLEDGEDDL